MFLVYIQEADVLVSVNVSVEAVVVGDQVDLVLVFSSCLEPEVLQHLRGVNSMSGIIVGQLFMNRGMKTPKKSMDEKVF